MEVEKLVEKVQKKLSTKNNLKLLSIYNNLKDKDNLGKLGLYIRNNRIYTRDYGKTQVVTKTYLIKDITALANIKELNQLLLYK